MTQPLVVIQWLQIHVASQLVPYPQLGAGAGAGSVLAVGAVSASFSATAVAFSPGAAGAG